MAGNNGDHKFLENGKRRLSSYCLTDHFVATDGASPRVKGDTLPQVGKTYLQVLIILLPLCHNADQNGNRRPVERNVLEQTLAEIKQFSSGDRFYEGKGWCHSMRFRGDFDERIRIEIEASFSDKDITFLKSWKRELELRFQQDSIYMSLFGPIRWL